MTSSSFRVLEACCCSGGMAEGLKRAGLPVSEAFDHSPEACDSYELNHGHRPVQIDLRDLLRMTEAGWSPGVVDLFVSDPPCTPWSRAGKRQGVKDERDLLNVVTRLIALWRPRTYLIGNVPGLDDSTQWHHLQRALAPLRKLGYCIGDWRSFDAADYGVPQHRVRPFWFGHLEGPCLKWPEPTHGDPEYSKNACLPGTELLPWVTCMEALQHLPISELGKPVKLRKRHPDHNLSSAEQPAKTLTRNTHGDGSVLAGQVRSISTIFENDKHPVCRLDGQAPTIRGGGEGHSAPNLVLELAAPRPHHRIDHGRPARTVTAARQDDSKLLAWPWDRSSTTVTSRDTIPPPGHHPESGSILSQPNAVVLSVRAAKILQGLPEDWELASKTKTGQWSMLGQLMPPALAAAVGRSVRQQLEATSLKRRKKGA